MRELFDRWLERSKDLRTYLSADNRTEVAVARQLLSLLPRDQVLAILRYLAKSYWERYCGWPDLFLHRESEFFFAEVKYSGDPLREEQKAWIEGNALAMHLPFKLVKVHKTPLR